jgi:hydroxymethylglutaryl-CoA synthase
MQSPIDVGLLGIEIYFPSTFVHQSDLEVFMKAPKGKFTVGLGQTTMACVNDREDINSISLTALNNLMKKHNIDPKQVGRLEVGTETMLDKSKSVKTVLMNLFRQSGNYDVEGITSINACYGSTNAIFNSLNWIQSKAWDGRYAIVVSSDIAVYPKGSARPTGGVGAIAMLFGPNAPVVFENVRSTFIDHTYDFYKPDPFSEYPTVDGHQSIEIYLNALRQCIATFKEKHFKLYGVRPSYSDYDYFCFHTPFSKMVQKSFFALLVEDIKEHPSRYNSELVSTLKENQYRLDAKTTKALQQTQFQGEWENKCERSLLLAKMLGNIYTGSLYNGLLSLLCDTSINLAGKKILMFSYGSGCAASLF